jgi:long-chain acyl-CoA synthetase
MTPPDTARTADRPPADRAAPPGHTLPEIVADMAGRGDHPALMTVQGEAVRSWSYGELADRALRLATGLIDAGVTPGEPVGLFAPNSAEWVIARLAIGLTGALAAPFEHQSTEEEVAGLVAESGCRRLFVTADHVPALRRLEGGSDLELHVLADEAAEDRDGLTGAPPWTGLFAEAPGAMPEIDPESPAVLLLTSGTTGHPKSFTLSYRNIAANLKALVQEGLVGPQDRVLLPLPLHHVYPYIVGLLTPFRSGSTVVFPESVAGPQLLQAMRAARVSVIIGVPRLYRALLQGIEGRVASRGALPRRLFRGMLGASKWLNRHTGRTPGKLLFKPIHKQFGPDIWLLISGGAKLEPHFIETLQALGWEVRSGYGLAETASIFTANLPDGRERLGSEGRPLDGGEARIADPDAEGIGEIQLRGPSVFDGYRRPEHNESLFAEGGWLRTGDLGYMDEDGFVYVTGRAKEMLVLGGGKNVFPDELEKHYGASPYVREVAVLEREGALMALVVPDFEAMAADGYSQVNDVLRVWFGQAGRQLPSFQRLAGFMVTREPLPRNRLGKIRRFLLPELYEKAKRGETRPQKKALSADDKQLLATHPAGAIFEMLQTRYPDKEIAPDDSPQLDLGIDSLEWVTLSLDLAERFGLRLSEDEVADLASIRDLLKKANEAAERSAEAEEAGGAVALSPEQTRWLEPTGAAATAAGFALHGLVRLIMKAGFSLRAEGTERIPDGPCVLAANHASDLDPLAVAAALPASRLKRAYWGGDAGRLFRGPISRAFCRAAHIFPVLDRAPQTTLAMAGEALGRGHMLTWFPESWRSPDGELQRFLPGVGRLLKDARVPAVPVFIAGTYEAMPRDRSWPRRHRVRVVFGEPVPYELLVQEAGSEEPADLAAALRERVAGLKARATGP